MFFPDRARDFAFVSHAHLQQHLNPTPELSLNRGGESYLSISLAVITCCCYHNYSPIASRPQHHTEGFSVHSVPSLLNNSNNGNATGEYSRQLHRFRMERIGKGRERKRERKEHKVYEHTSRSSP
ncbi:hypothetical protein CoHVHLJ_118 [Columbid alphaherpesvirus 1]|uniref:Uncharacterized protein n=1 Tax=Columbid alphaherpesvirus 1 TaxID=93386 RepID=A0A1V0M8N1_9ALPH|nr:hypothetical protein CoHVHLJ_098 [Columbid alphaherpesvirus 1]YP_009353012.1 hypothetical protein CoHVHLJ_118 [Columbid alphaherpesvirus 1]ARD71409.1 hypothetical protein CoHVHLJ_098 [Columbid alphaherpesvirus 1]ARD71429.1 hypothetical protein CoHVHLJ_118 [Columbid alphaherpesvirus 1]